MTLEDSFFLPAKARIRNGREKGNRRLLINYKLELDQRLLDRRLGIARGAKERKVESRQSRTSPQLLTLSLLPSLRVLFGIQTYHIYRHDLGLLKYYDLVIKEGGGVSQLQEVGYFAFRGHKDIMAVVARFQGSATARE
jgi:hypothetical protein